MTKPLMSGSIAIPALSLLAALALPLHAQTVDLSSTSFSTAAVQQPLPALQLQPRQRPMGERVAKALSGFGADASGVLFDGSPVKVLVRETNDLVFTPPGAVAMAARPKVGDIYAPGYDMGYTHGMDFEVSKTSKKGVTYKVAAGSHLYTQPTAGKQAVYVMAIRPVTPEYFTEANTFAASVDNFESPDKVLWKAGAGVYSLNSDHVNPMGATGQQRGFHRLTGKANEIQPQYLDVADGRGVRTAPYVDVALGVARTLAQKGRKVLRAIGYVEPQVFLTQNSLAGASNLKVHGELESQLGYKKSEIKLAMGADAIGHKDGTEVRPFMTLSYERRKWGVETKAFLPMGQLQNAVEYNYDNAPYNSVAIYTYLGRGRKYDRKTAELIKADY